MFDLLPFILKVQLTLPYKLYLSVRVSFFSKNKTVALQLFHILWCSCQELHHLRRFHPSSDSPLVCLEHHSHLAVILHLDILRYTVHLFEVDHVGYVLESVLPQC